MKADREAELAQAYDAARPRLVRMAYAVTGSVSDAEDVVTVTRLALDLLSWARARREHYVGAWLPEPVVVTTNDPADRVISMNRSAMH